MGMEHLGNRENAKIGPTPLFTREEYEQESQNEGAGAEKQEPELMYNYQKQGSYLAIALWPITCYLRWQSKNWRGVCPVAFLNIRVKCCGYSKPSSSATLSIFLPLRMRFLARITTKPRM